MCLSASGFYRSCASRRTIGSGRNRLRLLSGSEGSFICRLRRQENHTTALTGEEMQSPFGGWRHHLPPGGQCYSVKRFTQAYVITTCAFFVCKKSLGLQKNIKTSKKGLTNPQKFEAPPVSKGTTPIVNKEDLL